MAADTWEASISSSWLHKTACSQCMSIPAKFWVCSRCGVAKYCNSVCQKKAFTNHKTHCKKIGAKIKILTEKEKCPLLKNYLKSVSSEMEKIASVHVDTDYLVTMLELAEQYHEMGMVECNKDSIENSLNYRFKHLNAILHKQDNMLPARVGQSKDFQLAPELWRIACTYISMDKSEVAYNWLCHWLHNGERSKVRATQSDTGTEEDREAWRAQEEDREAWQAQEEDREAWRAKEEDREAWRAQPHLSKWHKNIYTSVDVTENALQRLKHDLFRDRGFYGDDSSDIVYVLFCLVLIKAKVANAIQRYKRGRQEIKQFLKGTDPELGEKSLVFKIKQILPVICEIEKFVVPKYTFLKGKDVDKVLADTYEELDQCLFRIHQIDQDGLYALTGDTRLKKSESNQSLEYRAKIYKLCFEQLENKNRIVSIAASVSNMHRVM